MRALKRRKYATMLGIVLILFIFVIRSISIAPKVDVGGHQISEGAKLKKSKKNSDDLLEERKRCYSHDVRHSKSYSAFVEYFPNLNSSFNQPKLNKAIFFIDANCSSSGLLDITPRRVKINRSSSRKTKFSR